ncbi:MAG: ester cyclase [Desulfobacterales bacterium]|nr:ester cyclase [Desulfobacterales bacterium]
MSETKINPKTNASKPSEKEITLESKGDISKIMSPGTERKQSLQGFDDDYVDIVDYIIRCTHKIWEEKGVGLIYSHYGHNIPIWTTDGLTYGREIVVENTLKTIAAFPDVRLIGDEVLWTGNDEEGFHTSHRITWVAHNTGHSLYGPPTGKRVVRTGIANCLVRENKIIEEWIARDEIAVVKQLGLDPIKTATRLAQQGTAPGVQPHKHGEFERSKGQTPPPDMPPHSPDMSDVEYFIRRSFYEIWNQRLLNRIDQYYVKNYVCHTTSARHLYGLGAYKGSVLTLLGAFPDAAMNVDHFYCMGNADDGYKTMTRWNLQGTYKGNGPYGPPTGKPFYLMGISHHLIKDEKFVEEWTYFDEMALMKQLFI